MFSLIPELINEHMDSKSRVVVVKDQGVGRMEKYWSGEAVFVIS